MEQNKEDLKIIIGKNIAEYRKIAGLSQMEFAQKINYSDKAISKWERGESLPDVIILKQIADFFGITLNDLAGYNQKRKLYIPSFRKIITNKIILTLISVGLVWLVATAIFVFFNLFDLLKGYNYLAFVYAIPTSFLVCTIFCAIFFRNQKRYQLVLAIFESLFLWTSALSVCLSIKFEKIWLIFLIAVPMQAIIILWNILKRKKKEIV